MRFCHTSIHPYAGLALCVCALCTGALWADDSAAPAPLDPAAKEELAYVRALVEANMPDLAEPVIAAAKQKWPDLKPKLKVFEIQGDLRMGKFADVQKVIDALPKKDGEYWALRLSMADAYYARSMMPECRKIYQEFFAATPKPGADIMDFYVESGFKWAQMCTIDKKYAEAVKMYENLLGKVSERNDVEHWCFVAQSYVELLVRLANDIEDMKNPQRAEYLNKATKVVNKLLWKSDLILVFGKAIAMKAHIEMLRGNLGKAQSIVNDYMQQLSDIHNDLLAQDPNGSKGYLRMSPMPECRYLLARVLWKTVEKEAKKAKPNEDLIKDTLFGAKTRTGKRNGAGAYNHAINVFINYPESAWAANAGEITEDIEKFTLKRYNKQIRTNVSADQRKKVRETQFRNAWEIYKSNDVAKTIDTYSALLAQYPEYLESVGALSILAQSYISQWQDEKDKDKKLYYRLAAEAIEGQIAERFAELRNGALVRPAGDETLRLAALEHDSGALGRADQLYALYFKNYPTHYNAAQMALSLGGQCYKKEDWEGAIRYYKMIAETYTNSTYYASALQTLSVCNGKLGNGEEQENWLRKFAGAATKTTDKTTARLSLALMQQKRGFAGFADVVNAAGGTNSEEQVEAMNLAAYKGVAGAIRDFRATAKLITDTLENDKTLGTAEKEKFMLQREQAQFLEGESWQRLQYPADKIPLFRQQAVKAYENYLATNPKGKYAPAILVKLATIYTADKKVEESQKAFARLQKDFPESDEAKNSVPRLAKTLIEMGLKQEGVEQYRQMLNNAGSKYTAYQFLDAGDALLEAKGWDVANDAYAKSLTLVGSLTNKTLQAYVTSRAVLGQAKAAVGQKSWAEAHGKLQDFIDKSGKSNLLVDAYEMLIQVASEEGRHEQDSGRRQSFFNDAMGAIKKLRGFRPTQADQDLLSLRAGDVWRTKMEAEEQMNLGEQAKATCRRAVATFTVFVQAHEPSPQHPAKDMTPAQLANLERAYGTLLPLMVKLGKEQSEQVLAYAATYEELFPEGKHKTFVQNAKAAAEADK